jgi:thiosulfate/3-mercaptopyruvate sulfurtransferase
MRRCCVSPDTRVILYRSAETNKLSAVRVWWVLRYFGHDNVAVLDGNLAAYKATHGDGEGAITSSPTVLPEETIAAAAAVEAVAQPVLHWDIEKVAAHAASPHPDTFFVDSRSLPEFQGLESRACSRRGHVANALQLAHSDCYLPEQHFKWKSKAELLELATAAGLPLPRPGLRVAVTCILGHRAVSAYCVGV